jgi:hypothetical protein
MLGEQSGSSMRSLAVVMAALISLLRIIGCDDLPAIALPIGTPMKSNKKGEAKSLIDELYGWRHD